MVFLRRCWISLLALSLNIIVGVSSSTDGSRTFKGHLYPGKRFLPSDERFYLDSLRASNRLMCIKFCQDVPSCQTIIYHQRKKECQLFSEHLQYGRGRLIDAVDGQLMTIRLDKDLPSTIKREETTASVILPPPTHKHEQYDL